MFERFHQKLLACVMVALSACVAHAQTAAPDYKLGAGDVIHIQVYQNPDLTVDTQVPESGVISYPLIGNVRIGDLSVTGAQKAIADALAQGRFVKNPQVTISLGQIRGSQVAVLGQVNRPGRFPLETTNNRPSDLLAAAGGVTPTGDDIAIVVGSRDGKPFRQTIDIPGLFIGQNQDKQLLLRDGDTIYVHRAPMFYIYGEAQRPGPYRIERGMTVMQALATGGGPTPRGSESRLRLSRKNASGVVENVTPNLTDPIQADDVIYVRESLF
ncbi:polysaccharide export protein EpsE [Xylophilus rhododendri]|uniref:Polysaccharide export protein EpsE n=1 Tax=Xylophilus rhododendri TaxID=2697032 RepID=A0A857J9T6_9BURK|nr:polysaccharide export protein EpsE [Xylophilus rhododendri]QHI99983.1 polysaccharide export protein EpsE [Xylophilus rhododendri]